MLKLLLTTVLTVPLLACQSPTDHMSEQVAISDIHTSQNSLDWEGIYRGVLPCADCAGIETTLTLTANGHYRLIEQYKGQEKPFISEGDFMWTKGGEKIQLDENGDHRLYQVGENRLWGLGKDGKLIQNYQLNKVLGKR